MMAGKARLFNDVENFNRILNAGDPKLVKALGREIKNFDSTIWDENKYEIVKQGNLLKFSQNETLRSFILRTGDKVIVEASPYDIIWGIGMLESNPKVNDPFFWRGENLLGFALMEVRDILKK